MTPITFEQALLSHPHIVAISFKVNSTGGDYLPDHLRFEVSFQDEQGRALTRDEFRSSLLENKARSFCGGLLSEFGVLESENAFSGAIEAQIHHKKGTVFLEIESDDLSRKVAQVGNARAIGERVFQTYQIKGDENISLDALALTHGFEFADLGDEWGWSMRHQVLDTPSGWSSKLEAFEHACEYLDIDVHTSADDVLSNTVSVRSLSIK